MKRVDGYVVDTIYPMFFYPEMQPIWLSTISQFQGYIAPDISQNFRYLELGCGCGLNLIVAAIANPHAEFVGVDFNDKHIQRATELAQSLQLSNIRFLNIDFEKFNKNNNEVFDFIVCHGVYSWVSEHNQYFIRQILDKSLKDQGLFYLHYMCFPGSATLQPIQKIFNLVDKNTSQQSAQSIELSTALVSELNRRGAFIGYDKIQGIVNTLKNDTNYLAHELLTNYWQPLYSVDVHEILKIEADLSYIGSAVPTENLDSLSIPVDLQQLISDVNISNTKEYLKDIARDSKQRMDLFQKKSVNYRFEDHLRILHKIRLDLILNNERLDNINLKTSIGPIQAPKEVISAIIESLRTGSKTFQQLHHLPCFQQNLKLLVESIFLLMNCHYIYPISEHRKSKDLRKIERLNSLLSEHQIEIQIPTTYF